MNYKNDVDSPTNEYDKFTRHMVKLAGLAVIGFMYTVRIVFFAVIGLLVCLIGHWWLAAIGFSLVIIGSPLIGVANYYVESWVKKKLSHFYWEKSFSFTGEFVLSPPSFMMSFIFAHRHFTISML